MELSFDPQELNLVWEPNAREARKAVKSLLSDPLFARRQGLSIDQDRDLTLRRLIRVASLGLVSPADFLSDPSNIFAFHELLGLVDGSLSTKFTAQFNLFGGTVAGLGTERHRSLLPRIANIQAVGCFSLTELGYGNNAVEMETIATWEPSTQTFDIHTPRTLACKYWITNGAQHAHFTVVYARLIYLNKDQGIHCFLVRIRNDDLSQIDGVEIEDMGKKLGLNGLDNARLRFTHLKVPREALLNRYSDIDVDGKYTCDVSNARERFLLVADRLISGRICIAEMMIGSFKLASHIGFNHSHTRLVAGPTGKTDFPLIDFQLQQQALIPPFARMLALHIGLNQIIQLYLAKDPNIVLLCCAIKPLISWSLEKFVFVLREMTGSFGLLEVNMIHETIAWSHAALTAEGDNSVLMMKVTSEILKAQSKGKWTGPEMKLCHETQLPRVTDYDSLDVLVELLKAKEILVLAELTASIEAGRAAGKSLYKLQMHEESDRIQLLARAYGERICGEFYLDSIRTHSSLSGILTLIGHLFALDAIRQDISWYLIRGLVSSSGAQNIKARWESCVKQFKPHIWSIVESFEIPPAMTEVPMVTGSTTYYASQLRVRL